MNNIEIEKERYEKIIRKFSTYEVLKFFSQKSVEDYNKGIKGTELIDLYYYKSNGKNGVLKNFNIGQWDLVEVCFNAIKYSNDYRGKKLNESDFYNLINENKVYNEIAENAENFNTINIFEHLQCITNVQFDFQTLNTIQRFNRMYQIMRCINLNKDYNQTANVDYIDFEAIFEEITGMDINLFINVCVFIVLLSTSRNNTNIYDLIDDIKIDVTELGFSKKDIKDVIEILARDYKFYKKSNNWNILKYYPIVKIDKKANTYIISNVYSLLLSFPNFIYWIIRNYYCSINSNKFTNYFGKCFEIYLEEIFKYYNINAIKLEEKKVQGKKQGKKTPDWRIETDKYILLVEQKASLFPVDARTTTRGNRFNKIEDFFDKTIVKAFNQLNDYNEPTTNKTIIRICLTFEHIYMEENVKFILEPKMNIKSGIESNWIVNIDEMEILMQVLNEDEEEFNRIIEKKLKLEKEKNLDGCTLEFLFRGKKYDYSLNNINHFSRIVEHFKDCMKNMKVDND